MFEYFPDNYSWSLSVMLALGMGGQIGEIDEICRPLKSLARADDEEAQQLWHARWSGRARSRLELARQDTNAGHALSAGRKYQRAAVYFLIAERHLPNSSALKLATYREGLACFEGSLQMSGINVEFVDIAYEGKVLPALFLPAAATDGGGRRPCILHLDGLDVTKEFIYLMGAEGLRERGVSVLICDSPGVGGALRLHGLTTRPDTETVATAAIEYLESRSDVDPDRVGVMALSLGGYYGPRAAAFEKRLKCCVVWGASWAVEPVIELAWKRGHRSVPNFQLNWVFGIDDPEQLKARIREFTLEGVADQIECPLLIVHGENDRQVPLWTAYKTFEEAARSARRELKIFRLDEGGAEHCQLDNLSVGLDYMHDWAAAALAAR